ncbi:MAG TPA: hypothetical protein VMV48_13730 [Gallionellaceae bacterium]|nr:hypothetical protein [Gallionellaceae bacterium]
MQHQGLPASINLNSVDIIKLNCPKGDSGDRQYVKDNTDQPVKFVKDRLLGVEEAKADKLQNIHLK